MTALARPTAIVNDRHILSLGSLTSTNLELSDSNKNPVLGPRWVLDTENGRPTVGHNVTLTLIGCSCEK
jgi:hypothetical protein